MRDLGDGIMKSGSSYVFNHKFEDKFDVRVRTSAETSSDIIQEFVDFLKACQFCEEAILNGLECAVWELEQSLKRVEKTQEY